MTTLAPYPQQSLCTFTCVYVTMAILSTATSSSFTVMISGHSAGFIQGDIERPKWVVVPYLFIIPEKAKCSLPHWKQKGFLGEAWWVQIKPQLVKRKQEIRSRDAQSASVGKEVTVWWWTLGGTQNNGKLWPKKMCRNLMVVTE